MPKLSRRTFCALLAGLPFLGAVLAKALDAPKPLTDDEVVAKMVEFNDMLNAKETRALWRGAEPCPGDNSCPLHSETECPDCEHYIAFEILRARHQLRAYYWGQTEIHRPVYEYRQMEKGSRYERQA